MNYKFRCNECQADFEVRFGGFYSMSTGSDTNVICPKCGQSRSISKVFTVPQIIYRGTGWAGKANSIERAEHE